MISALGRNFSLPAKLVLFDIGKAESLPDGERLSFFYPQFRSSGYREKRSIRKIERSVFLGNQAARTVRPISGNGFRGSVRSVDRIYDNGFRLFQLGLCKAPKSAELVYPPPVFDSILFLFL